MVAVATADESGFRQWQRQALSNVAGGDCGQLTRNNFNSRYNINIIVINSDPQLNEYPFMHVVISISAQAQGIVMEMRA